MPKEVGRLFEQAKDYLAELKSVNGSWLETKKNFFDFAKLLNQVLKNLDLLFLGRQLAYHLVATADLPRAFGLPQEAMAVLSELVSKIAKQAGFGSQLEIHLQGVKLREGPAIQVRFHYGNGEKISEEERQKVVGEIYGLGKKDGAKSAIIAAKAILKKVGGQLWLEFPNEAAIAYVFNWPAFDTAQGPAASNYGTYRYDIWLTDFPKIRQRFGIVRSKKIVSQVADFARTLVRHPVDMVIGFPERGMITVIYESQEGAASTVAARLSHRLKSEAFRLGKKNVTPQYRYQLSYLT